MEGRRRKSPVGPGHIDGCPNLVVAERIERVRRGGSAGGRGGLRAGFSGGGDALAGARPESGRGEQQDDN
jgi:hypothetical protein